ncbi:MAG: PadR family transcriptional regulator [Actinomycetota bacterium]
MPVRRGLLALLAEEPRHGYQLKSEFERRTGRVWPLNVGQVYTTLDRLERDGLVRPVRSTNGDRNQRTFAITQDGRKEVDAWLSASGSQAAPPRDELFVKVLLAAIGDRKAALRLIAAQRSALLSQLQGRRRAQQAASDDLAAELVHDALAVRIEADLRWLDHCEARLRPKR